MSDLARKIDQLPPELRREAEDYVDYLLERKAPKRPSPKRKSLSLSWAGALKDLGEQGVTAEQLKQEALDLMAGSALKGTSEGPKHGS